MRTRRFSGLVFVGVMSGFLLDCRVRVRALPDRVYFFSLSQRFSNKQMVGAAYNYSSSVCSLFYVHVFPVRKVHVLTLLRFLYPC